MALPAWTSRKSAPRLRRRARRRWWGAIRRRRPNCPRRSAGRARRRARTSTRWQRRSAGSPRATPRSRICRGSRRGAYRATPSTGLRSRSSRVRSALRALLTLGRGVVRGLPDLTAADDPIALFERWFAEARAAGMYLPESMTLATATPDGVPAARMMLLKGVDQRGFVFFTNYESPKGRELVANPRAALVFHWAVLQRQVRVEGAVERLTPEESEAYFQTRARGSQIGAWASQQSAELSSRAELDRRFREYQERFAGQEVPLPPFTPTAIEFWQGRVNRLHDRLRYARTDGGWAVTRLHP
ncbi:MAG: pyridoxamine 5'-phosphate oxidase [Gemmatimonadetes bacterium]|nr:pyridoxamine 5'-phosphate oxidase [Gemmatimonadota bacterium]